ncbi:MAG: S8 family peptidase [Betaproteobacteria bacterium]
MKLTPFRLRCALAVLATCVAIGLAAPASAADIATLRVMLHPDLAARGTLPADAMARLEAAAGISFTLAGTTRTGALDLIPSKTLDARDAAAIAQRLRQDRGVLWVQPQPAGTSVVKLGRSSQQPEIASRRLMVRLQDGIDPDWDQLLPRLSATVGAPLTVERQIGDVWVLSVPALQAPDILAAMAERLQKDTAIRYVDPVRRAFAQAAPNDPFYSRQWSLSDAISGINIEAAWALQPNATGVTVAVIDTGILPHPDLVGRVLPGYDFITDPGTARDGNGRDPDPRDEGDWTSDNDCGYPQPSFFHGLFVAGLIAANTNNGIGIAGVAGNVTILPVRVLGKCGGSFEDVFAGMLWASGVPIAGVPANKNPARVINLSLGGFGSCDQALQEAIDDALAQGAVVVAAAGNETTDVTSFAPANCGGVIAVAAHNRAGSLTSYSNFGTGITMSAPGGDLPANDLIYSTGNDGATVPENSTYLYARGTSFSAPLVAGTAALVLARNPLMTSGRVQDLLTGTARNFPVGSQCTIPNLCGGGMLDAGAAIGSTLPNGPPPPNAFEVVEFYRADLDHYFITASPAEINYIDRFLGGIFQRTGLYFYAYLNTFLAPPGVQPVCRFYADANVQINSHYYSADPAECAFVQANWPDVWLLEQSNAFYVQVPDAAGKCPDKTLPVYRFFNNRRDANHRYTVDLSVRRAMLNRAWAPEGAGPKSVAFCSPI